MEKSKWPLVFAAKARSSDSHDPVAPVIGDTIRPGAAGSRHELFNTPGTTVDVRETQIQTLNRSDDANMFSD